jgi:hypothetical protein
VKELGAELGCSVHIQYLEDIQITVVQIMVTVILFEMTALIPVSPADLQCGKVSFFETLGMSPPLKVKVKGIMKLEKACRKTDEKGELGQREHCR